MLEPLGLKMVNPSGLEVGVPKIYIKKKGGQGIIEICYFC